MDKNEIINLDIIDNGMNFEGIARLDNKVVFVPYAIKGEKVKAKIVKNTNNYLLAEIEEITKKSKYRKQDICKHFDGCGGCVGMHIDYAKTLDMKKEIVKNVLKKQGLDSDLVNEIYGMGTPYNYRNKVQYPVRRMKNKNVMGMFSEKSHKLIEVTDCSIQDKEINDVAKYMFECICNKNIQGYNEEKHIGDIKNIMVRKGINTGEILCIFVCANKDIVNSKQMLEVCNMLKYKYSNIKGIVANINDKKTNVILGNKNIVLYGEDRIKEKIGEKTYYISTNSFFQVNTIMAEILFSVLKDKLKLKKEENLLELYSGVGTIGIFLSDLVKEVYGAEIVQDAVEMAKKNVKLNNIKNTKYILGDASIEIEKLRNKGKHFDIIVVDPPRKGLDTKGIETILSLKPKKIGYVSCNPATLARDLSILSKEYTIKSVDLFDLFPWTKHVEVVTTLELK